MHHSRVDTRRRDQAGRLIGNHHAWFGGRRWWKRQTNKAIRRSWKQDPDANPRLDRGRRWYNQPGWW
jgi:hypothetical protein